MRIFKAQKIILIAAVVFSSAASAQFRTPLIGPFIPVGDQWVISEKSKQGAKSRVVALDQNPYPFCFSYAATALFDQKGCMLTGKDCGTQIRSSSLAVTNAGQNLPQGEIDITRGGVGSKSLQQLLTSGYVPDNVCNYNIHDPNGQDYQTEITNQLSASGSLKFFREGWQKYQEYTPYLERFYRTQFKNSVKKIAPHITEQEILTLLKKQNTDTELLGSLLLKPACFKNARVKDNYTIKTQIVDTSADRRLAFQNINSLLEKNIPVFSGVCNGSILNEKCEGGLHAVVVIAKATAYSTLTGDRRMVLWIVNTWGETWQQKNSDGWIFAEQFVERITGEVLWLKTK